jgi:hypothetical protein
MGDYQRPFLVTAHVEVVILADLENVGLKLQQDYGLSLKVRKKIHLNFRVSRVYKRRQDIVI